MIKATLISIIAAGAMMLPAHATETSALADEGKALIKQFAESLGSELKSSMDSGGPAHAISVCNTEAPEIASKVTAASDGWSVARASHKLRNPANAPDAYTAAVIADFLSREAAGEDAADMARAEIVEENGARVFRLVKAIPTGEMCLACHGGENVLPEVEAALAELYPGDQARGFTIGQMRGVFTLSKILD